MAAAWATGKPSPARKPKSDRPVSTVYFPVAANVDQAAAPVDIGRQAFGRGAGHRRNIGIGYERLELAIEVRLESISLTQSGRRCSLSIHALLTAEPLTK